MACTLTPKPQAKTLLLAVAVFMTLALSATAFYVPGVAPQDFKDGDPVAVKVWFFEIIFMRVGIPTYGISSIFFPLMFANDFNIMSNLTY